MDTQNNSLDSFLWEDGNGLRLEKPHELYHYTSSIDEAAIRAELKCRNSLEQEDKEEFRIGEELLKDIPADSDISKKVRCWTFSLCTKKNDKRMLGKYSCSKQGQPLLLEYTFQNLHSLVSILMGSAIEAHQIIEKGCYYLLPCLYQGQDNDNMTKLRDFLFGQYLEKLKCQNFISEGFLTNACRHIFLAMIKAGKYSFEHEFRLVRITFDGRNEERIPFGFCEQPLCQVIQPTCPLICVKEDEP